MTEPVVATPSLTDTLNTALKAVLDGLKAGVDFAKAEIPILLKEKLNYDFYSHGAEILFFLLVLIILIIAFNKVRTLDVARGAWEEHSHKEPAGTIILGVAMTAWSILTLVTLYINLSVMIKISLAPRLYLMEWLIEAVKQHT